MCKLWARAAKSAQLLEQEREQTADVAEAHAIRMGDVRNARRSTSSMRYL
jgi:hypothetical protein